MRKRLLRAGLSWFFLRALNEVFVMLVILTTENDGGLEDVIATHFGRCKTFTLVELEEGKVKSSKAIENPYYTAHQPFKVPEFLSTLKPSVVICGGVGPRAIGAMRDLGVKLVYGCSGKVSTVIQDFSDGKIVEGENTCHHV